MLGISRHRVYRYLEEGPRRLEPDYKALWSGNKDQVFWRESKLAVWRQYVAAMDVPVAHVDAKKMTSGFSDHNAVNVVGTFHVSWRLWWKPCTTDALEWWFSTPQGWYTSTDEGSTWHRTGLMRRPETRYVALGTGAGRTLPDWQRAVENAAEALKTRLLSAVDSGHGA